MKVSSTTFLLQTSELLFSTTFDFYQQKVLNGHLPSTSLVGANFQSSRCIKKWLFFKQKMLSIFPLADMYLYSCIVYCQDKIIRGNSWVLQKRSIHVEYTSKDILHQE